MWVGETPALRLGEEAQVRVSSDLFLVVLFVLIGNLAAAVCGEAAARARTQRGREAIILSFLVPMLLASAGLAWILVGWRG